MSSMQIDLYDALTGANITPEAAKVAIASLQEHIDMQVSRANEAVLAKLDGVQGTLVAKLDGLTLGRIEPVEKAVAQMVNEKQLRVQRTRWVVGTALTMIGLMSAGAGTLHALHLI
jgi:hypothetical protein